MMLRRQGLIPLYICYIMESSAILWPAGRYGLPKPTVGCPLGDGFQWKTGWRLQDTNNHEDRDKSNNSRSTQFHLDGRVNKIIVNRSFCMKEDIKGDKDRPKWPQGKYCIYKGQKRCPDGLRKGNVFWTDDEASLWNSNCANGSLPDGQYWTFTLIRFCCQTEGNKTVPIFLPTKSPFFLLTFESAQCQMVKWAVASLEWIYYHTSDWKNQDKSQGAYPYNAEKHHPTIYFCYYQGCNETLTTSRGRFHSPNHPRKYPYGQYCSWRIMVNQSKQIHLEFIAFSFQKEKHTDELYIYDGKDTSSELLGVFYGGHTPPDKGIYSSSNSLFLLFKSDKKDSYNGFNASYSTVDHSPPSETAQAPEKGLSSVVTTRPRRRVTSQTQEGTSSASVTIGTLQTLDVTSSAPATSVSVGNKTGKSLILRHPSNETVKASSKQGINVVAVTASVVTIIVVASLLMGVFFYCKRKKIKQEANVEQTILL
ncbi:uncharacterized protein [Montipora capricornis]|uniref:uncharacterized protein n=1 Tax=Montipora capricornis TaxID=246305 RepID=UPI0035F1498F